MTKNIINVAKDASLATVTVVGIDLAKNVFALHGINAVGKPVLVLRETWMTFPACITTTSNLPSPSRSPTAPFP